jgi:hypothetical protein
VDAYKQGGHYLQTLTHSFSFHIWHLGLGM